MKTMKIAGIAMAVATLAASSANAGVISTSTTAPTEDIISQTSLGNGTTAKVFNQHGRTDTQAGRGQILTLTDTDSSTDAFKIESITVRKQTAQTLTATMSLSIFYTDVNTWTNGTGYGNADGLGSDDLYGGASIGTEKTTETFSIDQTFANDSFVTFTLDNPFTVTEGESFAFMLTYDDGGSTDTFFQMDEVNGGAGNRIAFTETSNQLTTSRTFAYAMTGEAIPEPATMGLFAAFGGAVLFIRRRFMI